MRTTRAMFTALTAALLFATALTIAPPAQPTAHPPASNQHAPLDTSTITTTPTGCDGWSAATPYPIPVEGNAVVSLGGYIYSFGGGSNQYTPTTAAYKFDGNTWTAVASLPVSRTFASAVTDGTYIYIVNGTAPYTNNGTETNTLYRYDPITNTYTQLASDNYGTTNQAAVYLDGSIYRIGGISRVNIPIHGAVDIPISSVNVYNIAINTWSTASNYSAPIFDETAVASNGYIYTAGGASDGVVITKTYRYDPTTYLWDDSSVADLPSPRAAAATGLLNGQWLVVGGFINSSSVTDTVAVWGATTNTWNNYASRVQSHAGADGATLNDKFYTVGGNNGGNTSSETQAYTNICPSPTATPTVTGTPPTPTLTPTPPCEIWQQQPAYPYPTSANVVVSLNGYLYSFGGLADLGYTPHSYRYDGHVWTQIADLPTFMSDASAVTDGTYIYILNGYTPNSRGASRALYRYDPATDSYIALASPQFATYDQAAAYLNGKIYRIGGNTTTNNGYTNTVEIYNVGANTWARAADYPTTIAAEAAIALNGYIYTASGFSNDGQSAAKTYRYSPSANTWDDAAIADLPTERILNASDIYNGQWILSGSTTNYNLNNTTVIWNPNTNTWHTAANMVAARLWMGGASLGNSFYAIGGVGHDGGGAHSTNDNQRYTNTCPTPTPTPTLCPVPFGDISGDLFYAAIGALYCRGAVSGTDATHYSPAGTSTRGQFARVVVKGFGLPITTPSGGSSFTDVPPGYFAYNYIETGYAAGILSGYTADQCAAAGAAFPCYLPNRPITRAELTKLAVKAAGYPRITPTSGPTFVDVPASYFAYTYIETAYAHGIIRGTDATHFQPARNIRRDEMAQIVYKAVTSP